jgi:hypothetical protein
MSTIRKEQTNIAGGGGATKFEAVMPAGGNYWSVNHGLGTLNPGVWCWDEFGREITPWRVQVVDPNNIRVWFQSYSGGGYNGYGCVRAGKVAVI